MIGCGVMPWCVTLHAGKTRQDTNVPPRKMTKKVDREETPARYE